MSKILAVFGATGTQGSSVVNSVLNDIELSQQFKIRAIVRDVHSEKAEKLKKKKVEVVPGDMLDRASLEAALAGVHIVFIMTTPSFGPDAVETEYNTAKMMADIAVQKGAEYIIFSTLPSVSDMSNGKYTAITPFDAKAKAEKYIRGLPVKSAFCSLGYFMENLQSQPYLAPQPMQDGTWAFCRPTSATIRLPYLDATGDTGKFVGAILAEPDKFEGKTLCAATALYSLEEIADALAKNTGKTVICKKIPLEDFKNSMPFVPDLWAEGALSQEEYGYFGPKTEQLVAWAAKQARGRLTTLEEYLEAHPFKLLE
ncbi:putative hscarg dehydrogenase protein [Seiridium unicorne]|uniref:Hscarg dehydrogenase protein n=1 Tax=Seiridium unicorne TaxID=138068 RepID=A0ABR2VFA4_9PEZI